MCGPVGVALIENDGEAPVILATAFVAIDPESVQLSIACDRQSYADVPTSNMG